MKIDRHSAHTQISDIDLFDDEQCRELGRIVASDCVVMVRQSVPEKRLYDIQRLWGTPCSEPVFKALASKRLSGSHWRSILLNLTYISQKTQHFAEELSIVRVSFEKNKKGRPTGFFTNGELDWHCDQQALYDRQRIVGLMSLWGTAGSRTSFMRSSEAYAQLPEDDKSMVDELIAVFEWDGGKMSEDLIASQKEVARFSNVPIPNMECPLKGETASGVPGIKFPSHSFKRFRGMSEAESERYRKHLWALIYKPEHIYHHDWNDGEIVFMDQNITLHARPTNVKDGDTRTMARMNSYLDNLFPGEGPMEYVMHDGEKLDHETFLDRVDTVRKAEHYAAGSRTLAETA